SKNQSLYIPVTRVRDSLSSGVSSPLEEWFSSFDKLFSIFIPKSKGFIFFFYIPTGGILFYKLNFILILLHQIHFHFQIVYDKTLSLGSVFSHIKLQQILYSGFFIQHYGIKADIFSYKILEFIRRNFSQSFESCDFGFAFKFFNCFCFLPFRITINSFFLVAHPKKRSLQDIKMSFFYQFRKKLKKKSNEQQANMHTVNICISGDYDIVVP